MKILVTGSNGCVGSALKSICSSSSPFFLTSICIGKDHWVFINRKDCDLTNREETINLFKNIAPDYIVHLASYVPGFYNIDKVASFSNNVRINENVLEASHLAKIERGLFCLSVNMFAEGLQLPMNESMIFDGGLNGAFAGYAYSKRMLALQCQNYNAQFNRKYFGLIPCNVYGPNDNIGSGRLIPNLILKFKEAIKNDSDVIINGTGNPLRQFIYSIDLATIIKSLVVNYHDTKPIICCGNEEINICNLAYQIAEIMEFKNKIEFDTAKPDGALKKTISNNYLKEIVGTDFPFTSLKNGLKETINSMEIK